MGFRVQAKQITKSQNFRHGVLYTIFSFINNGINFILLLILAHYLCPHDYGLLNLFTTFITLLNILISLSTTGYVSVSFFQKSKETLRKIIFIALSTTTGMLLMLSCILLLFPEFLERSIGVEIKYLWIGVLICYFQVFNSLNLDIWRLEEKPVSYGIYGVSFAVCNFILSFWLIVGMQKGWEGRVYAWFLLAIIYFIVSVVFLLKRRYLVFSKPSGLLFKETYLYALPLLPHATSYWLKQGVDRYIINYFYDQSTVGYYSFAMNFAAIIMMIGTAFNATNSVYIFKKLANGYAPVKNVLAKQTKLMTILFGLIGILVAISAIGLIYWFIPRYSESMGYILPLCIGAFFQCLYLLWVNYLFFYKKTRQLMYITFSTAILQILLSLWLTRYSSMYTAYISMVIMALTMLFVYLRSRYELKIALT